MVGVVADLPGDPALFELQRGCGEQRDARDVDAAPGPGSGSGRGRGGVLGVAKGGASAVPRGRREPAAAHDLPASGDRRSCTGVPNPQLC